MVGAIIIFGETKLLIENVPAVLHLLFSMARRGLSSIFKDEIVGSWILSFYSEPPWAFCLKFRRSYPPCPARNGTWNWDNVSV